MKVLVDTDVWLDVALGHEDFHDTSLTALYGCIDDSITMTVIATTLKDIYATIEENDGPESALEAMRSILNLAEVLSVDDVVCRKALELGLPSYEQAIVAAAAAIDKVDLAITRRCGMFDGSDIRALTPEDFIEELGYEPIDIENV